MVETVTSESSGARVLRSRLVKPALLRAYFLAKLPLGAIAGLTITHLDGDSCEVVVPFGWRTRNPFGSMYFAAQSMGAELSCAGLALTAARGGSESVSVLPVALSGRFEKRAIADVTFTCPDGQAVYRAVNETLATGEGVTAETKTTGRMADGTVVSEFSFTWSFKRRSSRSRAG